MGKKNDEAFAIVMGAIAFLALEVLVYYGLVTWLIPTDPEVEAAGGAVVRNWNKVMYFILAYMGILITTLLVASSMVPRPYRRHVMFWFYLSLPTMLMLLFVAFN
ncbi:hypothetical protein TH61_04100 [Rufibacter sp. DG15C]|uniref:hypothetical protein n=1 Tax=Rufibacter sp. DG15C TaxID=1379909 RepID=UPI00078B9ACB|nr:hypothetical protein [Rufibacter sp. DG15C]AMM50518.1 hypothetical protein TH61_04100 [Rufibacter sp. DG15C]